MRLLPHLLILVATVLAVPHLYTGRFIFPNATSPSICSLNDTAFGNILIGVIHNCEGPIERCFMLEHDKKFKKGVANIYCYDYGFFYDDVYTCSHLGFNRLPDFAEMEDRTRTEPFTIYNFVAVDCSTKIVHLNTNAWIGIWVVGFMILLLLGWGITYTVAFVISRHRSASHNIQAEREYYAQQTEQVPIGRRRSTLPTWQVEQGL